MRRPHAPQNVKCLSDTCFVRGVCAKLVDVTTNEKNWEAYRSGRCVGCKVRDKDKLSRGSMWQPVTDSVSDMFKIAHTGKKTKQPSAKTQCINMKTPISSIVSTSKYSTHSSVRSRNVAQHRLLLLTCHAERLSQTAIEFHNKGGSDGVLHSLHTHF